MADLIFIQRARIGHCVFQLRDSVLRLNSQALRGKRGEDLLLRTIDPEFTLHAKRIHSLYLTPLVSAVVTGSIVAAIMTQDVLPREFMLHPGILFAFSLGAVLRGLPRVEFYIFRDHWKRPVLFIAREKVQADECDAFVQELGYRIGLANEDLSLPDEQAAKSPPMSAVRMPAPTDLGWFTVRERFWSSSIVCSVIAATIPLLPPLPDPYDSLIEGVVFLGAIASLCFGAFSFVTKERLRHFALLGMVLAVFALLFYSRGWRVQ